MKSVVKIALNGNALSIYEQILDDEYTYIVYAHGKNRKKYFLDEFDSLTDATMFALQYCWDH